MTKKLEKELVVALDIGTTKVAALVGEITEAGDLEVVGFASHPSRGLKRGVVVNIESTVQSIQRVIEEAELMAGCAIESAYAGIAGSHIRGLNSHGIVAIRDREIIQNDIDRVIDAAKAVAIPADQRMLHILPQEFIIDDQQGVLEPVGMSGVRLEAKVHIVTGAVSAAQNIAKCIRRCGLQVGDIVLEQLASSYSVLTDDEKELGVCLIDIGGGTTDVAIFVEGAIRHTAVIPIAGNHVTNDIAIALRTPTQHAERIKVSHGSVLPQTIDSNELIEVSGVARRPAKHVPKKVLAQVMRARYEELYELILLELRRRGFDDLITAGIVLTGGAAKVSGGIELAESIFRMPIRVGTPQNVSGLMDVCGNPAYATGVGLLLHGQKKPLLSNRACYNTEEGVFSRMKAWFSDNF